MAGKMNPSEKDITPEAAEKARKRSLLNALVLGGVFLLGAMLPSNYKAFAPLLFLIPLILNVADKIRHAGDISGTPPSDRTYSPPGTGRISSLEPYSYKPRDPKDPRRYKPIG
jgi:hypothetical protein